MINSLIASSRCVLKGKNFVCLPLMAMSSTGASSESKANRASTRLLGKSAIVTASTEGIGLAIAKKLALDGASVVVSSRQQKNVDSAVEAIKKICRDAGSQGRVCGIVAHVAKNTDRTALINEAVNQFGGLDIVISNAAVSPVFGPMIETTEVMWDKLFEINVKAPFLLVKEAAPYLSARKDGSVIFVASIAGFHPFKFIGGYSVTKTALLGLTKVLASELADSKIRVNCICPGVIHTKFSQPLWGTEEIKEWVLQSTPLRRVGQPDEVSGIVSFLCSDEAAYITGENIVVSGGMPSRL